MKRLTPLFFVGLCTCATHCSETPTSLVKKTWGSFKETVSSFLERSESAFYSREFDIPTKSRIIIKNSDGSVAIARSTKPTKLFIEAEKYGKKSLLSSTHISTQVEGPVATIETKVDSPEGRVPVYYTITVPDSATVLVEQRNGDIWVRDVQCPLSLQAGESGTIHIENAVNSVTARALKGSIMLTQAALPENSSIFLEAYRTIELKLPENINATLSAQTAEGLVTSTIPVTLEQITTQITKEAWRDLRKHIRGTMGRGGPSIVLDTTKGAISITVFGEE